MKLIVGLGNPGRAYNNTRHNIGFMIVDSYLGSIEWKEKFQGLYYTCKVNGEKVIFLKPQTYMNLSGECVRRFAEYFDLEPEDILVIHDDLDMPFGKIRLKRITSSGGHNGIKSIIKMLDSDTFSRFKFGISNEHSSNTKDFVLGKFNKDEQNFIKVSKELFSKIINSYILYGIEKTMNDYNGN